MNVVVTGGGTIAAIDDVRHIANVSTGRLSAAITEAALARGATVRHIHAPSALLPFVRHARFDLQAPDPAAEHDRLDRLRSRWLAVRDRLALVPLLCGDVADYAATLEATLRDHPPDLVFLAMAVGDFEPVSRFPGKIETPSGSLTLSFRPTQKVIRKVRDWAPDAYLVGFKLLSGVPESTLIATALQACRANRADLTVANDLDSLRAGRHTIHLVRPDHPVETCSGAEVAEWLVDRCFSWASERAGRE
ncbi:MAG TPA: phosphopantothenoylcysteine decarboxylase [Isosphaeraceae bacterium]|jgi:phosphopantothenate-cysteine ligase|nr:phosphopantothenoylcysteine decarboxylase [Isosphaeraceae bacterium]